jgi:HlyD family secretion protein
LHEAEAALFSARSNFAKMRQLSRPQEIDAARSAYERAQADFNMARITWERRRQLYERGVISKHEYDVSELDYKSKKATRDAAKKQLDLIEEGARSEDIEMAKFQVKQAEAKLSLAQKRVSDTRIESPISGVIAQKTVDPGDLVALGTPVANVLDMTVMETEVGVTEKELPYLRKESEAVATVVAYPERIFRGRIVFIGVKADTATGTFPVKVEFDNASGLLKSGMVAEVRIEKETYQNVVTIHQDAVLDRVNRKVIFVIEDTRSRERSIELGPFIEEEVIVKKGLAAGETFVVVGQQSLKNGSRVRIEGEE